MDIKKTSIEDIKYGDIQVYAAYKGKEEIFVKDKLPVENEIFSMTYILIDSEEYLTRDHFPNVFIKNTDIDFSEIFTKIYLKNGNILEFYTYLDPPDYVYEYKLNEVNKICVKYSSDANKIYLREGMQKHLKRIAIDTQNIEDLSYMFKGFEQLEEIPYISLMSAKNVSHMFEGCIKAKGIASPDIFWNYRNDLPKEKTQYCFSKCFSITNYFNIPFNWCNDEELLENEFTILKLEHKEGTSYPSITKYSSTSKVYPVDEIIINGISITPTTSGLYGSGENIINGINTIKIRGNFVIDQKRTDKTKNLTILKLGNSLTNLDRTFQNLEDLNIFDGLLIPKNVTSMLYTFSDSRINGRIIINSNVKDLTGTFNGCNIVENPIFNNLEEDCKFINTFANSNIKYFNFPENLVNIPGAFANCKDLQTITNFPKVIKDCRATFSGCSSLINIPKEMILDYVKEEDTFVDGDAILKAFNKCFKDCILLKETPKLKLLSNKINLSGMFDGCTSLEKITNIPMLETGYDDETIPEYNPYAIMFKNCKNLVNIPEIDHDDLNEEEYKEWCSIKEDEFGDEGRFYHMFDGCSKLKNAITPYGYYMYKDCISLNKINDFHLEKIKEDFESDKHENNYIKNYSYVGCINLNDPCDLVDLPKGWGGNFILDKELNWRITVTNGFKIEYELENGESKIYEGDLDSNGNIKEYLLNNKEFFYECYLNCNNIEELSSTKSITIKNIKNIEKTRIIIYSDKLENLYCDIKFNPYSLFIDCPNLINVPKYIIDGTKEDIYYPTICSMNTDLIVSLDNYIPANNYNLFIDYRTVTRLKKDLYLKNMITNLNKYNNITLNNFYLRINSSDIPKINNNNFYIDCNCNKFEMRNDSEWYYYGFYTQNIIINSYINEVYLCKHEHSVTKTIKIGKNNYGKLIANRAYYERSTLKENNIELSLEKCEIDEMFYHCYNLEYTIPKEIVDFINNSEDTTTYRTVFSKCHKITNLNEIKREGIEGVFEYKDQILESFEYFIDRNKFKELETISILDLNLEWFYFGESYPLIIYINDKKYIITGTSEDLLEYAKDDIINSNNVKFCFDSKNFFTNMDIYLNSNSDNKIEIYLNKLYGPGLKYNIDKIDLYFNIENKYNFNIFNTNYGLRINHLLRNCIFTKKLIVPYYESLGGFEFEGNKTLKELDEEWDLVFEENIDKRGNEDMFKYTSLDLTKIPVNFGGEKILVKENNTRYIEFECRGEELIIDCYKADRLIINEEEIYNSKDFEESQNFTNKFNINLDKENYSKIKIYFSISDNVNRYIKIKDSYSFRVPIIIYEKENTEIYMKNIIFGVGVDSFAYIFGRSKNIFIENDIIIKNKSIKSSAFSFSNCKFINKKAPSFIPSLKNPNHYFDIFSYMFAFYNNLTIEDASEFLNNLNYGKFDVFPRLYPSNYPIFNINERYENFENGTFSKCYNIKKPCFYEDLDKRLTIAKLPVVGTRIEIEEINFN